MQLNEIYRESFNTELQSLCEEYGKPFDKVKGMFDLTEKEDFDPFGYLNDQDVIQDEDCVLTFGGQSNSKLSKLGTVSFSLPAGYTCPFADKCKTLVNRYGKPFKSGLKLQDKGDIRCYAASTEVQYKGVRNQRWSNFDLLNAHKNDASAMADLIGRSIKFHASTKGGFSLLRIHESGDFFSQAYFDAWVEVARSHPSILFYAYTKSLPFWKKRKDELPKNFRLIASDGGTQDAMIDKEGFRKVVVVKDRGEAIEKKLHVDVNDFLAAFSDQDFALLLHGPQKKGSEAGKLSKKNAEIIKDASKRLKANPSEVYELLKKYTS